jgi:hypothetical protein
MDVITLLVTNSKSSLVEEPSEDSLDDTAVLSQTASMGCVPSCDSCNDPFGSQGPANLFLGIIGSVRIQLHWPLAPSTARAFDGRNRIHQRYCQLGVMDIGPGLDHRERDPLAIADEMPFRAVFPAILGIGASFRPPISARTELLSTTALDQSIRSAKPNSSSRTCQTFCQAPETCQSLSRRQQVMPLPHPSTGGSNSQAVPVRATKLPVRAERSDTLERPPLGRGGSGSKRGLILSHKPSGSRGFAISGPP